MAAKSNMLFDVLANILVRKSVELYKHHIASPDYKDAAAFMIRRYLTMSRNPAVRKLVLDNYVTLERMPDEVMYKWLLMNIPRQASSFITYLR